MCHDMCKCFGRVGENREGMEAMRLSVSLREGSDQGNHWRGLQQVNPAGNFTLTIGQKPGRDNIMYPNNIYIKNYATIKKYPGDIGVQLDQYDNAHGLKHDALARAQYKHWRAQ